MTENSGEYSMRPGQQNKRSRGRGSNNNNFNRKGANPLTRTYDSTGPDVKVRGTAQHVAEKYMSLARDSQSSGDRVMAENYLQHAEHYIRIIAAAQSQMQERSQRDDRSDNSDDNDDAAASKANNNQSPSDERNGRNERNERREQPRKQEQQVDGDGPQPVIDGTPAEVAAEEADGQPAQKSRRRSPAASRPRRTKRAAGAENAGDDSTATAAAESAGGDSNAAPAAESAGEAEAPKNRCAAVALPSRSRRCRCCVWREGQGAGDGRQRLGITEADQENLDRARP
nr:DUF4167 domain-containing protein [Marinicella sp. W31]MDC2879220.1 DUF4167 domain-containing protein [Marinicella sp. W31]